MMGYWCFSLETTASRPTTMDAMGGVASVDDVLAFKTTIENLESRLQSYIEFRTKVCVRVCCVVCVVYCVWGGERLL